MRLLRFKKYAIGAGGMLVLVMAILLATGWGSAVAAQITNVFVTNDAAHAVPVQQQGTAAVRSANSEVSLTQRFTNESDASCSGQLYTVPPGKIFVLEYVGSYGAQAPATGQIQHTTSGGLPDLVIPLTYVDQPNGYSTVSAAVHYAVPPGTVLDFQGQSLAGAGFCSFAVSIGGYLQPV